MSDAAQCPFCELRFTARWELKLHLDDEHPGRIRDRQEQREDDAVVIEENDPERPEPL